MRSASPIMRVGRASGPICTGTCLRPRAGLFIPDRRNDTPEIKRTVFVLPESVTKNQEARVVVLNDVAQRIG